MKVRDTRTLPSIAQEDLRQKVLSSILEGKRQVEAARLFGVTRQAVGKWVRNIGKEVQKLFEREAVSGGGLYGVFEAVGSPSSSLCFFDY